MSKHLRNLDLSSRNSVTENKKIILEYFSNNDTQLNSYASFIKKGSAEEITDVLKIILNKDIPKKGLTKARKEAAKIIDEQNEARGGRAENDYKVDETTLGERMKVWLEYLLWAADNVDFSKLPHDDYTELHAAINAIQAGDKRLQEPETQDYMDEMVAHYEKIVSREPSEAPEPPQEWKRGTGNNEKITKEDEDTKLGLVDSTPPRAAPAAAAGSPSPKPPAATTTSSIPKPPAATTTSTPPRPAAAATPKPVVPGSTNHTDNPVQPHDDKPTIDVSEVIKNPELRDKIEAKTDGRKNMRKVTTRDNTKRKVEIENPETEFTKKPSLTKPRENVRENKPASKFDAFLSKKKKIGDIFEKRLSFKSR